MEILKQNDRMVINSLEFQEAPTYWFIKTKMLSMYVEINIYDADTGFLMETINSKLIDISNKYILFNDNANNSQGQIIIDTESYLRSLNFSTGNFRVTYKFYTNILGTNDDSLKVSISKISPTRKEITIKYLNASLANDFQTFTDEHFYQFSQDFEFNKYANFGNNQLSVILNSKNEFDAESNQYSIILKLYDALSTNFAENTLLWIVNLFSDEIVDTLTLLPTIASLFNGVNILDLPNGSITTDKADRTFTKFLSENDILLNSSNFNDLYEPLLSATSNSYLYGIELNTNYSNFNNFVHFGSAAQMLDNFKKKVELVQYYETQSLSNTYVAGTLIPLSSVSSSIGFSNSSSQYFKSKKSEILRQFTRYERFLYFKTGSYFSSSVEDNGISQISPYNTFCYPDGVTGNLIIDSTWPKVGTVSGSGFPYILASPSNPTASAWFDLMFTASMNYDTENRDYLMNTVPEYIRTDIDANADYITFINMIGEFYDNIWLYINSYYTLLKRDNDLSQTLPNELIWNALKNYGMEINQSHDIVDLGQYLFGLYPSGSSTNYSVQVKRAQKEISLEIWNRLLNSIPYLYKSKGTKNSILGLLNCYGVPRDLITIREFGGPYSSSFSGSYFDGYNQNYSFVVDDFTHVVNMNGSQYISVPWVTSSYDGEVPDTIEMKFKTKYNSTPTMSLIEKVSSGSNSGFSLKLYSSLRDAGYLKFDLTSGSVVTSSMSSAIFPFYNDAYYNVFITRDEAIESLITDTASYATTYRMFVERFDEDVHRIFIKSSASVSMGANSYNQCWYLPGTLYLGGQGTTVGKFSGSMDEFRLWSEQLQENVMDWHSQYWPASNGNTFTSSVNTLQFRLTFNTPVNLGALATSSLINETYITASFNLIGSVTGAYASASAIGFTNINTYPYNFSSYERTSLVENNFVAPDMVTSEKIRIENNDITQWVTLPDGYVVQPLRMANQSNYQNLIFNKSSSDFVVIQGEQNPFSTADKDTDKLLIGFSPTQLINNDMIAFFGNTNLLTSIGDPSFMYSDYYPSVDTINNYYWQWSKTSTTFFEYIKYIRLYDKGLFEQILKMVPAQATVMLGTIYDSTMIHRNRVRLIYPETAVNYDYGGVTLSVAPEENFAGSSLYKEGSLLVEKSFVDSKNIGIEANGIQISQENFVSQRVGLTGDVQTLHILPIAKSFYKEGKAVAKPANIFGIYKNIAGLALYKFNPWNLKAAAIQSVNRNIFSTIFMNDTISTSADTPDGRPVIELFKNNYKELKVNFSNNPKLIVQ
jgi:hypothetical protein